MATEDGYVELVRGSYEEVKEIEQAYREATDTVYVHTAMFKNEETRDIANNNFVEDGGKSNRGSEQIGNQRLQSDATGNTEYLRTSDKREFVNDKADSKESAFSMPKFSIPQSTKTLLDKYENGEVSRERMEEQLDELWGAAIEKYGSIEEGENAKTPMAVPKQVNDNKFTERLKGIFKKSYYCKRYLLLVFL